MNKTPAWRRACAGILIILGCLTVTIAVAVVWLNQEVFSTDKYVETIAPLSQDPAIKDAVARSATNQLFERANAEQLTREALPDRADFLAAPIAGATQGFVEEQVRKLLDTSQFSDVWQNANREAHDLLLQVVLGRKGAISSENGKVVLDLSKLLDGIKSQVSARGIHIFDNISLAGSGIQFTIFEMPQISQAQRAINLLDRLAFWLPLAGLIFLGVGVYLSGNRMAAVFRAGLGVAVGMTVLLVLIALARSYYLDTLSSHPEIDMNAATSFFDIIMGSLKTTIRTSFGVALAIAALGFCLGPYPLSVRLRSSLPKIFRAAEEAGAKVDLWPAGAWITRQKTALRASGTVLALLILVAMDQPSLSQALTIVVILLAYLGILEFLARKSA